jgi:hypothetical protein
MIFFPTYLRSTAKYTGERYRDPALNKRLRIPNARPHTKLCEKEIRIMHGTWSLYNTVVGRYGTLGKQT